MGQEEKNREESLWRDFSETGKMPPLQDELLDSKGEEYAISILKGEYNQLTKVLLGETLARRGRLDVEGMAFQVKAAEWIKPVIFSKKKNYAKKAEMGKSFEEFALSSMNPGVVNLVVKDVYFQKAWDWVKRAKDKCARLVGNDFNAQLTAYVQELHEIAKSVAWERIIADERLYSSILFWIGKILRKTNGQLQCAGHMLAVLRKIDPEKLPQECYVRKQINPKPEKGMDYYPSTLEDLAAGIYRMLKFKVGK